MLNVLKKLRAQLYDVIQSAAADGQQNLEKMSEGTEAARDRVVALVVHTVLDCVEMGKDMGRKEAEEAVAKKKIKPPGKEDL